MQVLKSKPGLEKNYIFNQTLYANSHFMIYLYMYYSFIIKFPTHTPVCFLGPPCKLLWYRFSFWVAVVLVIWTCEIGIRPPPPSPGSCHPSKITRGREVVRGFVRSRQVTSCQQGICLNGMLCTTNFLRNNAFVDCTYKDSRFRLLFGRPQFGTRTI